MTLSFSDWLSPKNISEVTRLQFFAKGVVDGIRGGIHRSPHVGSSIEFKEHRPYVAGDETRNIDWKLFGKTDRLYVRQYEDETNLRCNILFDHSGSMGYAGTRSGGVSKHAFAIRLAACLAYLFVNQQDAVGIATFDTKLRHYLPPRNQPHHLRLILERLSQSVPTGETDFSFVLQNILQYCKARGVVMVISDCIGDASRIVDSLALLRSNHQEVVVFQILDDDELDFPFEERTLFKSLEVDDQEKWVDANRYRTTYMKNLESFQNTLRQGAAQHRIDWSLVTTSDSCSDVLVRYLARRSQSA
jgi:uncharacterized protein (DUF58 family)